MPVTKRRDLPRLTADGRGGLMAAVAALALGQAAAAGLTAFATRDVFATLAGRQQHLPALALVTVAVAGLLLAACRVAERTVAERVGQHYVASLRVRLFRHLSEMSLREVAARRGGGLALRFVGDLAAVRGWISLGVARLVSASIVLPVAATVLYLLDARLAAAAAIPLGLALLAMIVAGPRLGPAHERLRKRRARLAADMTERVVNAPELRLQGRVKTELRQLVQRTRARVAAALQRTRGAAVLLAVPDAAAGIAAAGILFTALAGNTGAATTAGALAALSLVVQPLRDLAGVWDRHRAWAAARAKCERLLGRPVLARTATPAPANDVGAPDLVFDSVAAAPLTAIDIVVPAGTRVAIAGPNGAGKSTLLLLAAGLERADAGEVRLGGQAVESLSAKARREQICYVGPRSPVLAGSLRRALTMGVRRGCDDALIIRTASEYGLAPVLERLGGLDGKLGEGGRNLSTGQLRRLHLARAALAAPALLLLDEPDDALDAQGPALVEMLVRDTGATTLLVTHNLDLAARMGTGWWVEHGRVSTDTATRQGAEAKATLRAVSPHPASAAPLGAPSHLARTTGPAA